MVTLALMVAIGTTIVPTADGACQPHRQTVTLHDPSGTEFTVALCGGQVDDDGHLRGARIVICNDDGVEVFDSFNTQLDPWLLRAGKFAGHHALLIGVRKTAIFDPVERRRPFIYAVKMNGTGLKKVWLGTSLSRPFVTADFGDLRAGGEDELVAIEYTKNSTPALGAYRWRGFGIEGIARSGPIPDAIALRCADVSPDAGDEVVVLADRGRRWQFVAYHLTEGELVAGAELWATVGASPARWELLPRSGDRYGAVRLSRGQVSRTIRFRPIKSPP